MSDLIGNPEDRFSHNEAQIVCVCKHDGTVGSILKSGGTVLDHGKRYAEGVKMVLVALPFGSRVYGIWLRPVAPVSVSIFPLL